MAFFMIDGRSVAQAEAFAVARSFAQALVDANVCGFCDIASDFVINSYEEILLKATAEAEIILEGRSTSGDEPVVQAARILNEFIVSASVTAFAQVRAPITITVRTSKDFAVTRHCGQHSAKCSMPRC